MSRKVLYNEEKYKKVNKESKELLEDYILELKSKKRAVKTIEQYVFDIKAFFVWVLDNIGDKSVLDLKKRDFRNFFLEMQEDGKSSARINRMQSSIRNMLEYALDDDDIYEDYQRNQMKTIKSIEKQEVRDIVFLTDEQVTYLIDYFEVNGNIQKALYVSLAYDSAGRRNEIAQVQKHSFMDSNNRVTNEVIGKRSKRFGLMYFKRTQELAEKWLNERGDDDIDELFTTSHGGTKRPLQYSSLYDWTVSCRPILKEKYNEDIELNPHAFRHTALENYSNGTHYNLELMGQEKLDIDTLKALANHESIDITNSYLKDKDEEKLLNLFNAK